MGKPLEITALYWKKPRRMPSCTVCPLCNNPGTLASATEVARVPCHVRRFSDQEFTVWRCEGCGSLHCLEEADLDLYYAHYPLKQHDLDFHTRVGYNRRLRLLRRNGIQPTDRILDYGCGVGLFLEFLRSRGYRNVSGFDMFVPEYSDGAVLSQEYDVVVSYDVIEHTENPREFMRTLAGLTRPGGMLVVGTPNADYLSLSKPFDFELSQPYHRHILSEKMLVQLATECRLNAAHLYLRSYFDSPYPFVNTRFMWSYINAAGGMLDVVTEPRRVGLVASSPLLWFSGLFGYFYPNRTSILVTFRKAPDRVVRDPETENAFRS